eukprot:6888757-Pyramimonas_sp.AAC.1
MGIEQDGIVEGGRSECIAIIKIERGKPVAYFLAGATLLEAAFQAFDKDKKNMNPQVQFTKTMGMPNVTIFDGRVPKDVVKHYVDLQNERNALGSRRSHIEMYNDSMEIHSNWEDKCKAERRQKADAKKAEK